MKIGVFGDSYAYKEPTPELVDYIEDNKLFSGKLKDRIVENIYKDRYFWHDYLQEKGHEVIDFALGGTDIYYSYFQWKYNHQVCDKCIFVVTSPYRYSIRDKKKVTGKDERKYWHAVTCYDDAKEKVDNSTNLIDKRLAEAFLKYYREIQIRDRHRQQIFNKLMLEDIKRQRPNTLFIPAISETEPCLNNIYAQEVEKAEIDPCETFDLRLGHLTSQNQYLLGKQVYNAIEKGVKEFVVNLDDYDFNFSNETIKKNWPNKKTMKQTILELYSDE